MTITFEYETGITLDLDYETISRNVIEEVLLCEQCPYDAEVSVLLTDNKSIQEINREHRQIDKPTDVLSFPMVDYDNPSDFSKIEEQKEIYFNPESGELMLGDIVVSVEKVMEQAEMYGHSRERELAFLIAHSMFHLLGYDHIEPEETQCMEQKQEAVLKRLKIRRQ